MERNGEGMVDCGFGAWHVVPLITKKKLNQSL